MCEKLGIWIEKSMYGIKYFGINRSTFLIDNDGRILKQWNKVNVIGHVKEILETIKICGIGSHGSSELLPKGRGRSPVNWSIIEGKKQFNLQLFMLTPGIDDGDIIYHETFDINEWDTCKSCWS